MLLYHFTKAANWNQILASGRIEPRPFRWEDDEADLIHLSKLPEIGSLPTSHWDRDVRMTVNVDEADVTHWIKWQREHLKNDGLNAPALGGLAMQWQVSEVPIESARWVAVDQWSWSQIWSATQA